MLGGGNLPFSPEVKKEHPSFPPPQNSGTTKVFGLAFAVALSLQYLGRCSEHSVLFYRNSFFLKPIDVLYCITLFDTGLVAVQHSRKAQTTKPQCTWAEASFVPFHRLRPQNC